LVIGKESLLPPAVFVNSNGKYVIDRIATAANGER